jgi:hypothetical protein
MSLRQHQHHGVDPRLVGGRAVVVERALLGLKQPYRVGQLCQLVVAVVLAPTSTGVLTSRSAIAAASG